MRKTRVTFEAQETLARLAREGRLNPEATIDEGASPDSPLHPYFTWDETAAAHKCRLGEARELIRSVRIVVEIDDHTITVPVYVHDPAERTGGYVPTLSLRNDLERARRIVQEELLRVRAALARANAVAEVLGLKDEMAALIQRVSQMHEVLEQEVA